MVRISSFGTTRVRWGFGCLDADVEQRREMLRAAAERNAVYDVVHSVLTSRAVFRMSML